MYKVFIFEKNESTKSLSTRKTDKGKMVGLLLLLLLLLFVCLFACLFVCLFVSLGVFFLFFCFLGFFLVIQLLLIQRVDYTKYFRGYAKYMVHKILRTKTITRLQRSGEIMAPS